MDFRLLGRFEVAVDGRAVAVGAGKESALLTLLLLHANETVSTERLIDGLWGEQPPRLAAKNVHVYVSRLRKALGADRLETAAGGYAVTAASEELDAARFERLAAEGRAALEAGDPRRADERLTQALDLWRGEALNDFRYAPFAREAIERLEELREAVITDRAEARLALGRHDDLISELTAAVAREPLRERPREQLMLALYRAGRQAEALELFRDTRRLLDRELGVEPGPALQKLERLILNHDPALAPPRRTLRSARAGRPALRLSPTKLTAVAGVAFLAVGVAAAFLRLEAGEAARVATLEPNTVGMIDSRTGRLSGQVAVGAAPTAIAEGRGALWVSTGTGTLVRIDEHTRRITRRLHIGAVAGGVGVGAGAVWAAVPGGGWWGVGTVVRVDPNPDQGTSSVVVRSGDGGDAFARPTPTSLAVGAGHVYVNGIGSSVVEVTGKRRTVIPLGGRRAVDGLAFGAGALWATSSATDELLRIDPATRRVVAAVHIASVPGRRVAGPYGVAAGAGAIWVADSLANAVTRVDPAMNAVMATIPVGRRPTQIAVAKDAVWVLEAGNRSIAHIDPRTNRVARRIPLGAPVAALAAGDGAVWAAAAGGGAPAREAAGAYEPLRAEGCSTPAFARPGSPQLLVASELVGTSRIEADAAAAIAAVFRAHRFRAGPFRVAYQACDVSAPADGAASDPAKCAAHARAFAGAGGLVGVIGPWHDGCAQIELPVLNTAPGGAIGVVGPANTQVGLTHPGPGTTADEPDRYYPTGVRNLVRLAGADDFQGAAVAQLADQLRVRRLFLLDDDTGYGYGIAKYVEVAAGRLGIDVVGLERWSGRREFATLARQVAAARPDAVVLAGCVCARGMELARALWTRLGPRVDLIAPDAFVAAPDEYGLSRKLDGSLWVTLPGVPAGRLPEAGRRFARAASIRPDYHVLAAAQAAEVLLDAIARSNGSRASIVNALRATRVRGGLIGDFHFDANGDTTWTPFSVARISAPRAGMHFSIAYDRTIVPPASLVA
jgi:YVTN family beta-propeller protein